MYVHSQADGTAQLQQGALPPLAATSPQLSGLLSQLLQHLSQVATTSMFPMLCCVRL